MKKFWKKSEGFDAVKKAFSEKASEYESDSGENKYRYILTGVIVMVIVVSVIASVGVSIKNRFDERILKPGEVDFSSEHTPVFIDDESMEVYYESGLFAPAVVEDFTSLKVGDIIYAGPVANMVKNNFPAFSSAAEIEGSYLLSFGAWEALEEEFYSAGVSTIDNTTYIAYEVVDAAIKEYFEIDEAPLHIESVTQFGEFTADNAKQAYKAASTGYETSLIPRISNVVSEKVTTLASDGVTEQITTHVTLEIECIDSGDQGNYELEDGEYPVAERKIVLSIRVDPNGSYKFTAISEVADQTADTAQGGTE